MILRAACGWRKCEQLTASQVQEDESYCLIHQLNAKVQLKINSGALNDPF